MENTFQESNNMLSDKIVKRLDSAIDDYILEQLQEEDKNVVIQKMDEIDKTLLVKIARYAVVDKDHTLDEYRKCKTLKEFKEVQTRDINRKFLFDVYTMLIGNSSVEEIEAKYCNDKKKDLK